MEKVYKVQLLSHRKNSPSLQHLQLQYPHTHNKPHPFQQHTTPFLGPNPSPSIMKTTSVITTIVAALGMGLANSVSADCFGSGETWSNVDTALANARTACNDNLKGSYNAGQVKSKFTQPQP